jgi:choice-of-anchor C domain-containing protein
LLLFRHGTLRAEHIETMKPIMRTNLLMAAVVGCGLAASVAQGASLLVNGGFEDPNLGNASFVTYGAGDPSLTGWTITTGSIDHIGSYWQAAEGNQSLDMNGTNPSDPLNQAGTIEQSVHIAFGTTATVTFDLAGNPDDVQGIKTLQVSLIGNLGGTQTYTFNTIGKTHNSMGWISESAMFNILTPGDYTLQFKSLTQGQFGPALDNVSMTVPDGGLSVALLGFALVGVEGTRRKLRK